MRFTRRAELEAGMKAHRTMSLGLLLAGLLLILAPLSAVAAVCNVDPSGTYIEAENYTAYGNNFDTDDSRSDHNGSGYLVGLRTETGSGPSGSAVEYELNFPTTGTYYMFVRGHNQNDGANNSIWYGIDGSMIGNISFNTEHYWVWDQDKHNKGPNDAEFTISSAGVYKITFWSREDGFEFDGFYIVTPTDPGSISNSVNIPSGATVVDPTSCLVVVSPDDDADGFTIAEGDCDDTNDKINPDAAECLLSGEGDGIDNNCSGVIDEGCYEDADGDGITTEYDCDDTDADIYPSNLEACHDGKDNDCDGLADEGYDPDCDVDDDSYTSEEGDCRDDRSDIHPGATEICGDLIDNDCTGGIDDGCDTTTVSDSGLIAQIPLILKNPAKPLVMLNMSNDHQLFMSAYSEYDDLNGDNTPDKTYLHGIDYFGYFDSHKCYDYDATDGRFEPASVTTDKYCSGNWSGNFLNWATMGRIDVVRKILYGGYRSTDTNALTVLERTYLPTDAHSWVKYYSGPDLSQVTPFSVDHLSPTATSTSTVTLGTGSKTFSHNFIMGTYDEIEVGDQLTAAVTTDSANRYMKGVVTSVSATSLTLEVEESVGSGSYSAWTLTNHTRKGVTLCNTTYTSTGYSQSITAPPLIRVALGDYSLWNANEQYQCRCID